MDIMGKVEKMQRERGWSDYKLTKESGLSASTISTLKRRNNIPSFPTLEAICKGFGITLSQFFADGNIPVDLTDEQRKMLEEWNSLTPEQKKAVYQLMKTM